MYPSQSIVQAKGDQSFCDWLYGGLDFSNKGDEGPHCYNYLTLNTRFWETLFVGGLSIFEICWGCCKLEYNFNEQQQEDSDFVLSSNKNCVQFNCIVSSLNDAPKSKRNSWPLLKRMLLVILSLTFGIEIGYKLATKSLIYLLNPCHVLTVAQIFLLSADHEKRPKLIATVFRVHIYLLSGALLAMLFPVVATRKLPFEQSIYWIQHLLLFIIPTYLIMLGKPFTTDRFNDMRWPLLSIGFGFCYHFFFLQPIAMITQVNLNNMLCPATSDPFRGNHYRLWATAHQHLYIILHGKVYQFLALLIIRIITTLSYFCVAITLKSWKWSIYLYYRSAAACSRYYSVPVDEKMQHNASLNETVSNRYESKSIKVE